MMTATKDKRFTRFATANRFALAASLAGVSLLSLPLHAAAAPESQQRGPGHPPPKCLPSHVLKQLPTFDLNKNGRLDPEEHHAMREAERSADLRNYDVNGDGLLSKDEHENLRHDKMVEHFEALDTDHSAEISKVEASASCTPIEHDFARIDSDGNGRITWSEFEKAAPKGPRGHHPPGLR